jgi:hypothetical protein
MNNLYEYVWEYNDISKIEKLNKLTDINTFWQEVRKLTRNVKSDHSINRWEFLAEKRFDILTGKMEE